MSKQWIANDLPTFMNADEFADVCTFQIGDQTLQINALTDTSDQDGLESVLLHGVGTQTTTVYVKQEDLTLLPKEGSLLSMDGLSYFVQKIFNEQGIIKLILERRQS